MSDGTDLRAEFLLDPSVTFLNHGSFGACPRAVFERYQEWQLELEARLRHRCFYVCQVASGGPCSSRR